MRAAFEASLPNWRHGARVAAVRSLHPRKGVVFRAAWGPRGNRRSFADEKSISGDAQHCVMVKAAPASALEMRQAEFALDFLVVAFDPPAQFGHVDEREQRGVFANNGPRFIGLDLESRMGADEQALSRWPSIADFEAILALWALAQPVDFVMGCRRQIGCLTSKNCQRVGRLHVGMHGRLRRNTQTGR